MPPTSPLTVAVKVMVVPVWLAETSVSVTPVVVGAVATITVSAEEVEPV